MTQLLEDLQKDQDVVIIDGPPLFIMDAQILASKAGGIVLVVRQGDTLTSVARSMLEQLHFMEANVFGAVLNGAPQKQTYYFDERIDELAERSSGTPNGLKPKIRKEGVSHKETDQINEANST
jgi:Mrp family chromosome partitioning ATPase